MDEAEKLAITGRAAELLRDWERPLIIETDINHAVALIGLVQLALRHPQAGASPSAQMIDRMIRELIDAIDPARGVVWQFLMMGFDPGCDV
jgi:hypothetical protein